MKGLINLNPKDNVIVHVNWGLTYGGIETMLVNIINMQHRNGAKVSLILINDYYDKTLLDSIDSGIEIYLLHRKLKSWNLSFVKKLNSIIDTINPKIIHIHNSKLYSAIYKKNRHKLCTTLHSLPYGELHKYGILTNIFPFINFFDKGNVNCIDKFKKVFSISNAVRNELLSKYKVESEVIYNGIVTEAFKCRSAGKSPSTPLRVIQVGRLDSAVKGQDLLIEACAKMKGTIQVDFIGDGKDMTKLQELVKELDCNEYVRFLGTKDQQYICDNLKDYDLFVQPSLIEGFGLTIAEAMAAGLPVLISCIAGPLEITQGERYGWTFPIGDLDEMIKTINKIIENYPKVLEKAEKARQHILKEFDIRKTSTEYLNSYQ